MTKSIYDELDYYTWTYSNQVGGQRHNVSAVTLDKIYFVSFGEGDALSAVYTPPELDRLHVPQRDEAL